MTFQTTSYFVRLTLTSKATSVVLYDYMRPVVVCPHAHALFLFLSFFLKFILSPRKCKEEMGRGDSSSGLCEWNLNLPSVPLRFTTSPAAKCSAEQVQIPPRQRHTNSWQRPLNMAGREPSKRVKKSRKPPPADRAGTNQRRTTIAALAVKGTRPKEEYCYVHGPQLYSNVEFTAG